MERFRRRWLLMLLVVCGACSCDDKRMRANADATTDATLDVSVVDALDTSPDAAPDTAPADTAGFDTALPDTAPPPPDECEERVGVRCDEVSLGTGEAPGITPFGLRMEVSADGFVVASTPRENRPVDAPDSEADVREGGAAYVYVPSQGGWRFVDHLFAPYADHMDQAGFGLAMTEDASRIALGVRGDDSAAPGIDADPFDNSALSAGAVHVFRRDGETYVYEAYLKPDEPAQADSFGSEIVFSADGRTLISTTPNRRTGGVYIFERDGRTWRQVGHHEQRTASRNSFGEALAINDAGTRFVVGDPREDRVHVYERELGGAGREVASVTTEHGYAFGGSLAMDGSGDVFAVGIPIVNEEEGELPAVEIYARGDDGGYTFQHRILELDPVARSFFGHSLSLTRDGRLLAVGSYADFGSGAGVLADPEGGTDDDERAGGVYLFHLGEHDPELALYVKSRAPMAHDTFGRVVRLYPDGSALFVTSASRIEGFRLALSR